VKAAGFEIMYCESYWLRIWERFCGKPFLLQFFMQLEAVRIKMFIVLLLPQFCVETFS
jgi:hypothetical protein